MRSMSRSKKARKDSRNRKNQRTFRRPAPLSNRKADAQGNKFPSFEGKDFDGNSVDNSLFSTMTSLS